MFYIDEKPCVLLDGVQDIIFEEVGIRPSRASIYRYITDKKLPKPLPLRVGNRAVFDADAVRKGARNLITAIA